MLTTPEDTLSGWPRDRREEKGIHDNTLDIGHLLDTALERVGFMEGRKEQPEGLVCGNADNSNPGDP